MKNQRIIGINGLSSDGRDSTDKLLSHLNDTYSLSIFDYTYRSLSLFNILTKLKFKSKKYQLRLSQDLLHYINQFQYPPNIVAHSFGCLLIIRALSLGAKVNNVFLFAPAVESNEIINTVNVLNNVYVIYHPNDLILKLSKIYNFSDMGNKGYDFPGDVIKNVKYSQTSNVSCFENLKELFTFNHSIYFLDHNISYWSQFVFTKIINSVNKL